MLINEETEAVWLEELAPYLSAKLRALNVIPNAQFHFLIATLYIALNFLLQLERSLHPSLPPFILSTAMYHLLAKSDSRPLSYLLKGGGHLHSRA